VTTLLLIILLLAAPAYGEEPPVPDPSPSPTAEASPSPTPSPTPMPPLCSETNPSLERCLAVMDPAQALNQRVTALEQRDQQIIAAVVELQKRLPEPTPTKDVKKK